MSLTKPSKSTLCPRRRGNSLLSSPVLLPQTANSHPNQYSCSCHMCSVNPTTSNAKVKLSSSLSFSKKLPGFYNYLKRTLLSSKTYESPKAPIDTSIEYRTMDEKLTEFIEKESKLDAAMIACEFNEIRNEQESWRLPGSEYMCLTGHKPAHNSRNRYRDILPYDSNRVKLRPEPRDAILEEDEEDGYINASHVVLKNSKYAYIAAQAPLHATLKDWWKMIFQNDCYLIVMLCKLAEKGMPKCHRYYPEEVNAPEEYGGFHIEIIKEETFHEYVSRELRVRHPETGEERVITQLHYSEWPDHGCPDGEKQILEMIELMCKIHDANPSTILIHCSAGCGRTGTIIAINAVREAILAKCKLLNLNLYDLVIQLRKTRLSMVQTADQYQFLHKCVVFYCQRYLDEVAKGSNGVDHEAAVAVELEGENAEVGANEESNAVVVPQIDSIENESNGNGKATNSDSESESSTSSSATVYEETSVSVNLTKADHVSSDPNDSAECVIVKL